MHWGRERELKWKSGIQVPFWKSLKRGRERMVGEESNEGRKDVYTYIYIYVHISFINISVCTYLNFDCDKIYLTKIYLTILII